MNNKLKFRTWDIKNQVFLDNSKNFINGNGVFLSWKVENVIVQRFTGLQDKMGKDIYEGDILKSWKYEDWGDEIGFESLDIVCFRFGSFNIFARIPKEDDIYIGQKIQTKNVEVVGNIFQNPELINNPLLPAGMAQTS